MTFEEQFSRIQQMFDNSGCDIIVLPPDEEKAKKLRAQKGDFTPLAAVLAGTGGVSVNGMLRLCGSGIIDFFERNQRLAETGMTIVGEDVFGGIFALDKQGMVMYLAPDELAVEEFGDDYDELLEFACSAEGRNELLPRLRQGMPRRIVRPAARGQGREPLSPAVGTLRRKALSSRSADVAAAGSRDRRDEKAVG